MKETGRSRLLQEGFVLIEGGSLSRADAVGIFAYRLCHGGFADFGELSFGEADEWISVLIPEGDESLLIMFSNNYRFFKILPEPITLPQLTELHGDDAGESRTDQTPVKGRLSQSTGEEVDVVDMLVGLSQAVYHFGRDFPAQIFPGPGPLQVAHYTVVIVGTDAVIATCIVLR